jgi:hypothetical protein
MPRRAPYPSRARAYRIARIAYPPAWADFFRIRSMEGSGAPGRSGRLDRKKINPIHRRGGPQRMSHRLMRG